MIRSQLILDLHGELIVDNFAGGGGASTGIELALGRCVDVAINHDPEAVELHRINHPQTHHECEDVFKVDPLEVTKGRPVGLAWFSPDCKHFSKAKGGKPRSKKIRGLAWVMVKWAAVVSPRVMVLENVEEFKTWGPLLDDGSPCPKRKGQTYRNFVARLENLGYQVEDKELRACDYGAPTIRKRLFLIARRDGQPIVWPEPTHGNPASDAVKAKKLKPWRTAAECIDWSIPCPSIFERKKPLAEATMRRIARGIQKFVINAADPFIVKVNHSGCDHFRGQSLGEPLQTITSKHGWGLATPFVTEHANASNQRNMAVDEPLRTQCAEVKGGHFAAVAPHLSKFRTGSTGSACDEPVHTITAGGEQARPGTGNAMGLVGATLVQTGYGEREGQAPRAPGLDKPLGTVVAGGTKHAHVSAFLAKHYTDQGQRPGSDLSEPVSTITTQDHNALVTAHMQVNTTGHPGAAADEPVRTICAGGGHHALIAGHIVRPFGESIGSAADAPAGTVTPGGMGKTLLAASHISKLKGTCKDGQPVADPLHTVQAGGNHYAEVRAFLIKYYSEGGQDQSCVDPMHTIPTRDRIGLVTVGGEEYVISDIGMRMLEPHELYAAQGFPSSYIIAPIVNGRRLPKHAQVRMCGNSVCPPLAKAIVVANVPEMAVWGKKERAA